MSTIAATGSPGWRGVSRWLGNLFLGMAIGLLGYYSLTNVVSTSEQAELREEVPPTAYEHTLVEGPTLDFEGWEDEDLAYWEDLRAGGAFGRLVAEKMGLDSVVVKGVTPADLRRGPGWITYTDVPGPSGNCGISGHRTTYGAPFRQLDRLKQGDTIEFYSPYRRYTYRVVRSFKVTPDKVEVVASTEKPTLTLTACDPPYSARYRLIVQSELVEVRQLSR